MCWWPADLITESGDEMDGQFPNRGEPLLRFGEAPEYQGGRVYPVAPEAHARLRAHWQEQKKREEQKRKGRTRPAETLARELQERRQAREAKVTITEMRTKLEPQQLAWLELLLRAGADEEALTEYRKSLGVHHKTFAAAVLETRKQIAASKHLSGMAEQMQQMLDAAEVAQDGAAAEVEVSPLAEAVEWSALDEARPMELMQVATVDRSPAVIQPKGAGLDQIVEWLGRIRAMRDELAEMGVTVEGSLSISIDL